MGNIDLNEILEISNALIDSGDYENVILYINDFLDNNPEYKENSGFSFENTVEKALYEKYYGEVECKISPISKLYGILYLAYAKTNHLDESFEYLKFAREINPISPDIQLLICDYYLQKDELDKVKEITDNISKFNYTPSHIYNTYYILSIYYSKKDVILYHNLKRILEKKDGEDIGDYIRYINDNNIQIMFENELTDILKENDFELYKSAVNYNSYTRGYFMELI